MIQSAGGACTSSSDRRVVRNKYDTLIDDFRGCMVGCVKQFGGRQCGVDCAKGLGFSEGCAGCAADLGICSASNCVLRCFNPNSAACTSCAFNSCIGGLVKCSGLDRSELPSPNAALLEQGDALDEDKADATASMIQSAGGKCTSSSDRRVVRNKYDTLIDDFRGCMVGCVKQFGGRQCGVDCAKGLGFSEGCAGCAADLG